MKYLHNYDDNGKIPEHIQNSFEMYLVHGIEPGSFVRSAIENDLVQSVRRADAINIKYIVHIATWITFNMPVDSWGNNKNVQDWMNDVDNIRSDYVRDLKEKIFWKTVTKE